MRSLGICIVLFLWILFGWKTCTDATACCGNDTGAVTPIVSKAENACPICFNYNESKPIPCNDWTSYRDGLLKDIDEDDNLELTIQKGEKESQDIANKRADAIVALFVDHLPADRIKVKTTTTKLSESDKISCISRTAFRNIKVNAVNENIVEVDNKSIIYFPFNSTKKLRNSNVESYLNDVADKVKKSKERVRLTGHTDNVDSPEFNMDLGMRRANVIKQYLISKGVSPSQLIASSKGESMPIATNETAEGRAKNRRTELEIIK